jgi:uncharacterized membrane protein YidH (DUF202 family)
MAERALDAWQRRLIPLMAGMVVIAALFFAFVSIREFDQLKDMLRAPPSGVPALVERLDRVAAATPAERLELIDRQARLTLEAEGVARRYQQSHAIILGRLWTRFMAFITGTILALVGAAFILGKLREPVSEISGGGGGAQASIRSASPGIVLATLGTVLMLAALFAYFDVRTTDTPNYMAPEAEIGADVMAGAPGAPPAEDGVLPATPAEAASEPQPEG